MLKIGLSGIIVPGKKEDYPLEYQSASRLLYYNSFFNTIEINSTFYKLPKSSTLLNWNGQVGSDFDFTLKFTGDVTHSKKLKFDPERITQFMLIAAALDKSGCILIQFPPSITSDYSENVEEILSQIQTINTNSKWKIAVEFRNSSWYHDLTWEMLNTYNSALVYHDLAKSKPPILNLDSNFIYLRYHGPTGNYRDSYSNQFLENQAAHIQNWLQEGKKVYAYFNNTMGAAFENARFLKNLMEE